MLESTAVGIIGTQTQEGNPVMVILLILSLIFLFYFSIHYAVKQPQYSSKKLRRHWIKGSIIALYMATYPFLFGYSLGIKRPEVSFFSTESLCLLLLWGVIFFVMLNICASHFQAMENSDAEKKTIE